MIAWLPRYAPYVAGMRGAVNLAQRMPGFGLAAESMGFARKRRLPSWRKPFRPTAERDAAASGATQGGEGQHAEGQGREVLLFADTFNRYFEPENLAAAEEVLAAAGYRVSLAGANEARPLCCGRTFLAAGLVEEARHEAARFIAAVKPAIDRGIPLIGLEPSCLLTLRDEFLSLHPGVEAQALAKQSFLVEEFITREHGAGRLNLSFKSGYTKILVHGHCHQKAFGAVNPVLHTLRLIPGTDASLIESSCCGMAGAFGYNRDTYFVSVEMAELDLLPALRKAERQTAIVADGFSCRHQIGDLSGREAQHSIQILRKALLHG